MYTNSFTCRTIARTLGKARFRRTDRPSWPPTPWPTAAFPGRDAELRFRREDCGRVRIEVSDARGERLPEARDAGSGEDGGRGLLLVAALAEEWGTTPRPGAPGKTVRAVVPAAPVRV